METTKNLRALYLAKILYEQTDEDHPLRTNQLIEALQKEFGISAHRVTIYEDMEQSPLLRKHIITEDMAKGMAEHCCIEYHNLCEIIPMLIKNISVPPAAFDGEEAGQSLRVSL